MSSTSRRTVLGGAAAAAAAGAMASPKSAKADDHATFVLVHGAWHGGWCWRDVVPFLTAAGHTVYTPTMTGLGDRWHLSDPSIDLSLHITDIVNTIDFEDLDNIVLVGHSYGGVVISGVADQRKDKIKHLVYLDAVLTENGAAMASEEMMVERDPDAWESKLLPVADWGFLGVPEDHPSIAWLERHLRPHPVLTLTESIAYENGGRDGLPKTFVRCWYDRNRERGEILQPFFDNEADWNYVELETGHDLMVTAPKETADILMDVL